VFELFDDELLRGNNRLDEIANRNDTDQPPAVQDRQVANPPAVGFVRRVPGGA
jgi:hypothetical protein